jgi:hypothetical protein
VPSANAVVVNIIGGLAGPRCPLAPAGGAGGCVIPESGVATDASSNNESVQRRMFVSPSRVRSGTPSFRETLPQRRFDVPRGIFHYALQRNYSFEVIRAADD